MRPLREAAVRRKGARHGEDYLLLADRGAFIGVRGPFLDGDAYVYRLGLEAVRQVVDAGLDDVHLRVAVLFSEIFHKRRQHVGAEEGRRADVERPAPLAEEAVEILFERFLLAHHAFDRLDVAPSRLGQLDRRAAPVEEGAAPARLLALYRRAERRLRDVELLRGFRDALFLIDFVDVNSSVF